MIKPIDIAMSAHDVCFADEDHWLSHEVEDHLITSRLYAEKINEAGLNVTGKQVIDAILEITGYDGTNKWIGHPPPDLVIAHLKAEKTVI